MRRHTADIPLTSAPRDSDDDAEYKHSSKRGGGFCRALLLGAAVSGFAGLFFLLSVGVSRDPPSTSEPTEKSTHAPPRRFARPDAVVATMAIPLTTVAPKPSGGDDDLNAILDNLMGLHRQDVAKRESGTALPLDFPVYQSSASVVVTMADGGYAACAIRLLESVRDAGRWAGELVVLVPTDEKSLPLTDADKAHFAELGAKLFPVMPEKAGGSDVRGAGSAAQYGKVALLVLPRFRKYESVLYLDADGVVGAPLQPLLNLELPANMGMAMPTWPSARVKHESFYDREVNLRALSAEAVQRLKEYCPDRKLVGITAWFYIRPAQLPPAPELRQTIDEALELWRPAFRFNDQGLWNAIFYNTSAFYPLCISGPNPNVPERSRTFNPLITGDLAGLADAIDDGCGPANERRRPMYYHGLKDCLSPETWERKKKDAREMSSGNRKDLSHRYDRIEEKKSEDSVVKTGR